MVDSMAARWAVPMVGSLVAKMAESLADYSVACWAARRAALRVGKSVALRVVQMVGRKADHWAPRTVAHLGVLWVDL